MSVYVKLTFEKDGTIASHDEGCGCCSGATLVTRDEAIKEVEDALFELNELLVKLVLIKENNEKK